MVNKLTSDMSLTGNGLRDWLVQRLSSLIIAVYFIFLVGFFCQHPNLDFMLIRDLFAGSWMQIFTLLTLLSLFLHAWVGVWTVITDYIKPFVLRFLIQALVILALFIYFFWGVEILWRLA